MIKLDGIGFSYGDKKVFDGFSAEYPEGAINCIIGPSGCGKTTLLNILSGVPEYSGRIEGAVHPASYVFQEARLIPQKTVRKNLDFILKDSYADKAERSAVIERYLALSGLTDAADSYPAALSGGMAQRLSLIRAFAFPSRLLLMDEPFKELDTKIKAEIIAEFLKIWEADRRTAMFVTHDIGEAVLLADNIYLYGRGMELLNTFQLREPRAKRKLYSPSLTEVQGEIYKAIELW